MRGFEEDFDFDSEQGTAARRICDFRHDVYESLEFSSAEERLNDPELQARIAVHQERVQMELAEVGT